MAGEITSLNELSASAIADTDLFEVVDVSDTSMAATGTNKRVRASSIRTYMQVPAWSAYAGTVFRTATQTIGVLRDLTVVSALTTSPANNKTVIQAVIDAVAGTYNPGASGVLGHGGGGVVKISDQLYELDSCIELKYGVGLEGTGGSQDRNGFSTANHSFQGTCFAPTSSLPSIDVNETSGVTTRRPVILLGRTVGGSGTQSTTNPHGVRVTGISINCERATSAQGILICDSQYVMVDHCVIGDASGSGGAGIEVISTNAPDDGAHGLHFDAVWTNGCETGLKINGSGSTDSYITNCRILQSTRYSIEIGGSGGGGGWQISGCHLTTGSSNMNTGDLAHIRAAGAPCIIENNYFDTTGGWCIYVDTGMMTIGRNYFKGSNGRVALIWLQGNGRKSVISDNVAQLAAANKGFIAVSSTSGDEMRGIWTDNLLGDGGEANPVGCVVTSAGVAVAESNAAATIARNGTTNYMNWGNRFVVSAV